jgi:hypothetical protein
MFRIIRSKSRCAWLALCGCGALAAPAQTELTLVREIQTASSPSSGHSSAVAFGQLGRLRMRSFQFKVAPDQSLLIFYPNTSGKWPLDSSCRKWWTAAPETEELDLPGWSEANALGTSSIAAAICLITPDGNYALALGGVGSVKDAGNIPFPPNEPIERKPDLLITVIDLNRWQIAGALHTATVDADAVFRGGHIVKGKWLALQGLDREPESVKYEHLYDRMSTG